MVVAATTGLLVGVATVGLVVLGGYGCDALRGTPSCGGPGLLMLGGIVAAAVAGGGFLLRLGGVADPWVVSFLAVATQLVVVLLFFIDWTFSAWMWLLLPLLSGLSYPTMAYVVTRLGDPGAARR